MTTLTAALIAGDPAVWAIANKHIALVVGRDADHPDLAQSARLRLWRAAQRPGVAFPCPGALAGYAQRVAVTTVQDARRRVRARADGACVPLAVAVGVSSPAPSLDDWRGAVWDALRPHLRTPAERVAIAALAAAIPPRETARRWPDLFGGVTDVDNARRNVLGRIRRAPATMAALREIWEAA